MDMENNAMSWDSSVEAESTAPQYVLLPAGEYNFDVVNFERGNFPGSAKMCASPKAIITLKHTTANGETCQIRYDLILNKLVEFKLSEFFRAIGQKKPGEALRPDWNSVVGSRCRAKVKQRTYIGKDGKDHTTNDIESFLDYNPAYWNQTSWQAAPKSYGGF